MADEIVAVYRAEVEQYKKAVDELTGRVQSLTSKQDEAGKAANKLGINMGNLGKQIIAAFGVTASIAGFVSLLKNAISVTANFERQMSKVRAISGATAAEMDKLEKSARRLGATTRFTATQVGELQEEYARLGFTTKEILAATEATLNLAAATGTTLGEAASVAGATVRGFGLDASETSRVTDVMALSFSRSALSMSDFAEAMKMAAPIARAANIDIETTTALLGQLADAGLRGSLAGTALKNLLSKLSDENSDLSKELGMSVKNSDDLFEAFKRLQSANIDLTKATELTDERSKAAFVTLVNGISSAKDLKTALDGASGTAKEMAEVMDNNLKGAVNRLSASWEALNMNITEGGTGAMTEFIKMVTEEVDKLNESVTKLRGSADDFNVVGFVMGNVMKAILEPFTVANNLVGSVADKYDYIKRKIDRANYAITLHGEALEKWNKMSTEAQDRLVRWSKAVEDATDIHNDAIAPLDALVEKIAEIAPTVEPQVRSIASLSAELKLLKEALENAEIGSTAFFEAGRKVEQKAKEIERALFQLRLAAIEDEGFTLLDPKAIEQIEGVSLKQLNAQLAEAKKRKEEAFEFSAEFNQAVADIDRLEERIRTFGDAVIDVGEDIKIGFPQQVSDGLDEALKEFAMYARGVERLIAGISAAQAQASQFELQVLQDELAAATITREEYDAERRKIMRKQAMDAKALALLQAIIGTAAGVAEALPNVPLSIIAGLLGAVQIGVIASQPIPQFAKGVIGLQGAGTETSDSIPAMLSRGESVMTAAETRKHRDILEGIRKGTIDRIIHEQYVKPAVDAALLNGFADMGKSAALNGLGGFNDMNLLRAIDRHRASDKEGFVYLATELKRHLKAPKRGYA